MGEEMHPDCKGKDKLPRYEINSIRGSPLKTSR